MVDLDLPAGGMLWLRFDRTIDVDAWAERGLSQGVSWFTDRRYAFDQQPCPFARLSFASLNEQEIGQAVMVMAATCH